jgi:hypothetical protein
MSLATRALIGFALGVGSGIFFGEIIAPVGIVGDAFIGLLQMTVLPYVTVSLILGLGQPLDCVRTIVNHRQPTTNQAPAVPHLSCVVCTMYVDRLVPGRMIKKRYCQFNSGLADWAA